MLNLMVQRITESFRVNDIRGSDTPKDSPTLATPSFAIIHTKEAEYLLDVGCNVSAGVKHLSKSQAGEP
jgi:hypothetical protein